MDSIPGLLRSLGGGNGNPLQYSCLKNPTDGRAWQAAVHGVAKSQTWLKQISTHRVVLLSVFWGTSILFSVVGVSVHIPTSSIGGFPFLHILSAFIAYKCFYSGHSDLCGVIPQCSFCFASLQYLVMFSIFPCVYWSSLCLLWRTVSLGLLPVFWLGCLASFFFFLIELPELFIYFGN